MTPSARLAAAADILDGLTMDRPVDPQLKAWARSNRFAGSGDRRAIADRLYTCLRQRRSAARQGGGETGRAIVLGSLRVNDHLKPSEIETLCTGGYGLAPLTDAECTALAASPAYASEAERLDWPDWLYPAAHEAFGDDTASELDALRQRAPLDVRVNTLLTTLPEARAALLAEGIDTQPVAASATALRLLPGAALLNTAAFRDGWVEPQDAASQAIACFADAQPGETVLDFCAGAGGKTLALAAAMANEGHLLAHDIDPRRMSALPERANRARATLIRQVSRGQVEAASCDRVLVDAPCSGSGSWRRDPLGKWRLTPERLEQLGTAQEQALEQAARFVRPGGTLTYATCSVLPIENTRQVTEFLAKMPDFLLEDTLSLWPARDATDGFYGAQLRRTKT